MDYSKRKYTIEKDDFALMVKATDEWLEKYNKKAPFVVYIRKDGEKSENYISYKKYQELKAVFEEYKGIDVEVVYKALKKPKTGEKDNK